MDEQARETLDGYVVDLACLRKYPRHEMLERARVHTRRCALMGHCVESGYGLVNGRGELALLDSHATPLAMDARRERRSATATPAGHYRQARRAGDELLTAAPGGPGRAGRRRGG